MSIRCDVLDLPRVKKARLSKTEKQILGDAVEEAVERLNGITLDKIWRRRGRPANFELAVVTKDIMESMIKSGLPANWWLSRTGNSPSSLLVEIMDMVVQEARRKGAQIAAPGSKHWQRVIKLASSMYNI